MSKLKNFRYLLISTSISTLVGGIIGPFYVLFVQKLGGTLENFGISFGLMAVSQSLTSYMIGKYSDKLGRKTFLILSNITSAIAILFYLAISSPTQLFILQIFYGIIGAMWRTSETAFLGDITKRKIRGLMIGKYNAIVGLLEGIAMIIGGFVVGRLGIEVMFYVSSFAIGISTIPLFLIKE